MLLTSSSDRKSFCTPGQTDYFTLLMQMFLDSLSVFTMNGLGILIDILFLVKLWQQVNPGQCRLMKDSRDNNFDLVLSSLEENVQL